MEIKVKGGKLKTEEQLRDEAIDKLVEALEEMGEDEALDLGNAYREANHDCPLYVNDEDNLNDELDGKDPYEILQMAYSWNENDSYFGIDGWNELGTTDDVWEGIDLEDLAGDLIDGDYHRHITSDIQEILDDYEEALEKLNNYNEGRALAEEVVRKYVNCEASVTDLLQALDKLAKTDEYWKEEE